MSANIPATARAPEPETEATRLAREQSIDEELDESFPASDPPSWVQGTAPAQHSLSHSGG